MTSPQSPAGPERPDFTKLPAPLEFESLVETHDVDPAAHAPESKFATPEIEDMARTGALGGGF